MGKPKAGRPGKRNGVASEAADNDMAAILMQMAADAEAAPAPRTLGPPAPLPPMDRGEGKRRQRRPAHWCVSAQASLPRPELIAVHATQHGLQSTVDGWGYEWMWCTNLAQP